MESRNYALEYDKSYTRYDLIVNLFQLGMDTKHRSKALRFAGLKEGDTVLDLCCGSGLSFKATQEIIGKKGKIIAVDANGYMLQLAKNRARKNGWDNISFIECPIEDLKLDIKIDFAFFALCWYDKDLSRKWIDKVSEFMDKETGRFCFFDYKMPDNWLRPFIKPILWLEIKWLGEAYTVNDLDWKPKELIGNMLRDARFTAYYFDCMFAVAGKPLL
ncbi:hypothetical protein CAP35_00695 [Chitinophagaceae bacterium IBVUCB1]|nr:hypothetical protein CAP35_00695 [Chitinophagaceae bacterium IBVUCB1]